MTIRTLTGQLLALAEAQEQVLRRSQLTGALTRGVIRAEVDAGRWQEIGPVVIVLHNGPLTPEQKTWAALLSAPGLVAVAGRHAARLHRLRGWRGPEPEIVVPKGDLVPTLPFAVTVHESRRLRAADLSGARPPRTSLDRSFIDAAAWSADPKAACGLLCAAVQQGLTTAARLTTALRAAGRVRHCALLRVVLTDIAGGAQALSEVEFGRFLARHDLPAPTRQVVRLDASGKRRYLDVELVGPTGVRLHIEVDGALHLLISTYWNDMDRHNELVLAGTRQLRFPSISWRLEPEKVADQIRRGLVLDAAHAA